MMISDVEIMQNPCRFSEGVELCSDLLSKILAYLVMPMVYGSP